MLIYLAFLMTVVSAQLATTHGRISQIFDKHPTFNEELLIEVFHEKPTEEFLLSETESLLAELILEFGNYIEVSQIGELTYDGRFIELVSFKTAKPGAPAVLYDGAHHSRELITIKM